LNKCHHGKEQEEGMNEGYGGKREKELKPELGLEDRMS
jgi:hypothetical protein